MKGVKVLTKWLVVHVSGTRLPLNTVSGTWPAMQGVRNMAIPLTRFQEYLLTGSRNMSTIDKMSGILPP